MVSVFSAPGAWPVRWTVLEAGSASQRGGAGAAKRAGEALAGCYGEVLTIHQSTSNLLMSAELIRSLVITCFVTLLIRHVL